MSACVIQKDSENHDCRAALERLVARLRGPALLDSVR